MADGIVQVPPDSTGKMVDAASMDVGANTVYRQRIVIGDNSATAQFALVTGGALTITGTMNISAMPTVTVTGGVAVSGTAVVSGNVNISVFPALVAGTANIGGVSLVAGTSNIGFINNISATVVVAGNVNISVIPALVAGTANIGFINNISATVTVAGNVNISTFPALVAGTANIGAVSLAAGTANIGFINNISATVMVATANNYVVSIPSASHGPKTVIISTSAQVILIADPGAGLSVYVTQLMCTNAGTAATLARVGTSASPLTVLGYMQSAGGGFVMNFDPPWKLSASATCVASVKPNSSGNVYFTVNFYVAA